MENIALVSAIPYFTYYLHSPVGNVLCHSGAVKFRAVRVEPVSRRGQVEVGRHAVHVVLTRHELGVRLRDVPLHLLKRED